MEQKTTTLEHSVSRNNTLSLCKEVVLSPLLYIPFFIKIIVGFFFASTFVTKLFLPFVHYFVTHPTSNPYKVFYERGEVLSFPYPTVMLLVTSISFFVQSLFVQASEGIARVDLLMLRIPLLVADAVILAILIAWFKGRYRRILLLYFCSPVLIYISYFHGQLDVIPVAFLFASIFFLTKEKDWFAMLMLGGAIASKTGMIVVLPFIGMYLLKERKKVLYAARMFVIPFVVFIVTNSLVGTSSGFIEMVLKTKEQFKILGFVVHYGTSSLYVAPLVVLGLFVYFGSLTHYSRNVLMTFFGFAFSVLLLFTEPRQGWFFWVIPFLVYFYVQRTWKETVPFFLLTVAYLIYFAVLPTSDFFTSLYTHDAPSMFTLFSYGESLHLPMNTTVSLSFTFLQAMLLLNVVMIYKFGVALYTKQKLFYKPFLVGVAGDSGSGKTLFSTLLQDVFSSKNTVLLSGDDRHKWERGHSMWQKYTHLDPLANNLHADIDTIYALKYGKEIVRQEYDHVRGSFTEAKRYSSKRLVIYEGLHAFFLEKVRRALDLTIFIAHEDQVRYHWKVIRDSEKRGYSKEQVLESIERRKDDGERFVSAQEKHADIVVSLRNDVSLGDKLGNKNTTLNLSLFITCENNILLEPLFTALETYFTVEYLLYDDKQKIKCTGDISSDALLHISQQLLPEFEDIFSHEPVYASGYQGLLQLFVAYYIVKKVSLESYA